MESERESLREEYGKSRIRIEEEAGTRSAGFACVLFPLVANDPSGGRLERGFQGCK